MKISCLASAITLASLGAGAHAFTSLSNPTTSRPAMTTALSAQNNRNNWMGPAVTTAMGWALASQMAVAAPQQQQQQVFLDSSPQVVLAVENLDFALPSYDGISANTGGFGQGTEARLGQTDSRMVPGANEKAKQAEAMERAEQARLARKEADKQARIQRDEDQAREAAAKKKRDAEKVKALFGV